MAGSEGLRSTSTLFRARLVLPGGVRGDRRARVGEAWIQFRIARRCARPLEPGEVHRAGLVGLLPRRGRNAFAPKKPWPWPAPAMEVLGARPWRTSRAPWIDSANPSTTSIADTPRSVVGKLLLPGSWGRPVRHRHGPWTARPGDVVRPLAALYPGGLSLPERERSDARPSSGGDVHEEVVAQMLPHRFR